MCFCLRRDIVVYQGIEQEALESYFKFDSSNNYKDLNIAQELPKGKKVIKENLKIPLNISKLDVYEKKNNFLSSDSLKRVVKEFSSNGKDDFLLRRLMFELSPKEYASLIPLLPSIKAPVGKSGPGIISINSFMVASGLSIR